MVTRISNPIENMPRLEPHEYTVGWISALPIEYAAAIEMLDEEHEPPARKNNDDTLYTVGRMQGHNIVIVCLPAGVTGIASAASLATGLIDRFPNAKIGLMVGIGGGVPSDDTDIRLGDVVVSQPGHGHGGVVQYDMGKRLPNGEFERTSHLDKPPNLLLSALAQLHSNHIRGRSAFASYLSKLEQIPEFSLEEAGPDRLFRSAYRHKGGPSCAGCDEAELIPRDPRSKHKSVQFHYGTIASANSLIRDGIERDRICQKLGNILCFETEAAGLMNNFPCLVIRGVCDYADSHKNKRWQPYAAATAAAYAKELLSVIPPKEVADLAPIKAPWVLPFNKNPQFTGRSEILGYLHKCLKSPERHPCVAIHGLGGSGKSAIVIEFAYQARDRNPGCAVFWVSSFTVERFQESYRNIARELKIPGADNLEQDILEPVQRRLSGEDQGRWLMIVDNVDEKGILFDTKINGHRLYDYLPHSRRGIILFTTRDRKIASELAPSDFYALGEMESTEAKELLGKALRNVEDISSEETVSKFLEMLAYLPLAIIQALAFIKANDSSIKRYVELFQRTSQSMTQLLQHDFNDPNRATDSLNAVFLTWKISFHHIEQQDKLAAEWLAFSACIAPQNIPRAILPSISSEIDQDKAIGTLTAYAFLTKRVEGACYDVHPLIHHVIQDWLKENDTWIATAQKAINWLKQLIPSDEHRYSKDPTFLVHGVFAADILETTDNDATLELLENIGHCYCLLGQYSNSVSAYRNLVERRMRIDGLETEGTLTSMNELGLSLVLRGDYTEAVKLHQQVLALCTDILGVEHPKTISSQLSLATTYQSQGRWKEAESLHKQVIKASLRVLGVEHRLTLASQSNLALIYQSQGRWKEAELLYIHVVETSLRVFGVEHIDTLTSQSNLALTYQSQGRWKEAESLCLQVIEIRRRILGIEHPDTLTSQSNLASTYQSQGKWKEAESLYTQGVERHLRVLGPEHHKTLTCQSNLALTYQNQGRWKEAESLYTQVVERNLQVLGPEHPITLTSHSNLALTYQSQGRWKEAESLYTQVIEARKLVLGVEHPNTLTSQSNLAATYQSQGRLKEAEALGLQVMETRKRVLGLEHPDTLTSQSNLQWTYHSQGRWKEADSLYAQVIETRKRVLGREHPDTLTSQLNLASGYQSQGRWKEAESLYLQVLEASLRVLGVEHPNTLTSQLNLALLYQSQSRWKEAESLYTQVIETSLRVFGLEHPLTLISQSNLAATYNSQGRLKEAESLGVQVMETRKRVLGLEHPDTVSSMGNLAFTLKDQARLEEAVKLIALCAELSVKVLGANHELSVDRLGTLALWQQSQPQVSVDATIAQDTGLPVSELTDG